MKKLKSKLKSFAVQDDLKEGIRVPFVLSEQSAEPAGSSATTTPFISKVLGGDSSAFHFSKSVLDCKDRNEAQRIFVERAARKSRC